MTDNEIIKALECCSDDENYKCNECPLYVDCEKASIAGYALGIINRQKAEVAKKDTEIGILIRKKEALRDEIAEQQAEIERLRHILVSFMSEVENWEHKHGIDTSNIPKIAVLGTEKENCIKQAKSEAYREFAESVKQISKEVTVPYIADTSIHEHKTGMFYYGKEDFDNLVKELTESNE